MDQNAILLALGGIGAAALLSQWLAWRLRLPAILFLLLSGIVAGPLLGWLDPDEMFGPLLFPLVSLAVALILFEGSLTLHFSEWKEIGTVVHRMVTIGALSTWGVIALAAHYLLDFSWEMALLFGTLTLVTGPTVIVPMLRVVRPKAAVANILRWEGIVIDPIGALLAVVVYSFIISSGEGDGWLHSLQTFGGVILCGSLFGILGGWALGVVLRRHWLPDYLHNLATLAAVLGVFIASNRVMHESGLLAVTLMGMGLANMKGVDVRQILHFKENLSVLLISGLFILLAARLDINALLGLGPAALLVLLLIQFVARPLNAPLDLVGIGHLLGVSPAGELNTLAAMRFRHEFGHRQLFGLPTSQEAKRTDKHRSSDEHRGRPLGQRPLTYAQFASLLSRGAEMRTTLLTDNFGWNEYQALHGESAVLLFARDPNGRMHVATPQTTLTPGTGWTLLSLIEAEPSVSKSQATEIAD